MNWSGTIFLVDIFTSLAAVAAIVSLIFALIKWNKNKKLEPTKFIKDIVVSFYQNKDYAYVFYQFDYGVDWYTEDFHDIDNKESLELQRKVDSVLTLITYICYLKKHKMIKDAEFEFVRYEIDRTLSNDGIVNYLYNLYHFSKEDFSYKPLIDYGKEKHNWFTGEFEDEKSEKYPHYLIP